MLAAVQSGAPRVVARHFQSHPPLSARLTHEEVRGYTLAMTIELPDLEGLAHLSPGEARLELACALYSRDRVGKVSGAELAGVDFFSFQRALAERGMPTATDPMLSADLDALKFLFPQ